MSDADLWTMWCVWHGTPLLLGWRGAEGRRCAVEYHEFVWRAAKQTLAERSPNRSPGYEALLKARLDSMRAQLRAARTNDSTVTPHDIFSEELIGFYYCALAQLILLGVVPSDDEHCFIELKYDCGWRYPTEADFERWM